MSTDAETDVDVETERATDMAAKMEMATVWDMLMGLGFNL